MRVLGVVSWTSTDKFDQRIAGVLPLFDITAPEWRPIRAEEEFPARGLAFWYKAAATENELIYFRAEESPGGKDEFKVADHHLATEVHDFRRLGTSERVRVALAAGLNWPGVVPGRALLWCADDAVVGPVKLATNAAGLLILDQPQRHKIPCYHKERVDVREVQLERAKRFVLAQSAPLTPDSFVDWDADKLVARRAITWAAERAKGKGTELAITRRQIEEVADYLTEPGADADSKLEQYRLRRTLEMFAEAQLSDEVASSAIESLQECPAIALGLERLREQVKAAAEEEARKALAAEQDALEGARLEREIIQAEIIAAQTRLENVRAQVEEAAQEVDVEISRRIGEILEKPATLLAEAAILKAVIGTSPATDVRSNGSSAAVDRTPAHWPQATKVVTEFMEFKKSLVKSFKAAGTSAGVAHRIHAAVSARLVPLVAGPRAMGALEAYARVVCGGRIYHLHASPSFFEPSDIFGKVDPNRGRFLPHPAGLVDIIEAARRHSGPALVVIEGANRAPTESYLLPLLRPALSHTTLRLFHPSVIAPDDPYRDLWELEWPPNLLVSATLVEGATTLPVTPDIWGSAVLIETDDGVTVHSSPPVETTEIDISVELSGQPEHQAGVSDELLEALTEFSPYRGTSERFLSALSHLDSGGEKLKTALVECLLVPVIVSAHGAEEREDLLARLAEVIGSAGSDSSSLQSMVRRVRRRVA